MSTSIESRLEIHSDGTGIPKNELRKMCIRFGLEALDRGELKIGSAKVEKLPVYVHAGVVEFLQELIEASEIEGGIEEFADLWIGDQARTSLAYFGSGLPGFILDAWDYGDDEKPRCESAMREVVSRWEIGEDGELARKEACK